MIQLAAWDRPLAHFFLAPLDADPEFGVDWMSPHDCERFIQRDRADVALVPPLTILRDPEPWEVVPDVGVAAGRYPYANLILRDGLEEVGRIGFDPRHRQEVLLTQIVMREHYRKSPEFVPVESGHPQEVLEREGAVLVADVAGISVPADGIVLNVGQEWFELVAYPATWGLLAAKAERLDLEVMRRLRDVLTEGEDARTEWLDRRELPEEADRFIREDLILRIEREVEAGLVEMAQYLFFHGTLEEIPQMPFLIFPDEDENESAEAHE